MRNTPRGASTRATRRRTREGGSRLARNARTTQESPMTIPTTGNMILRMSPAACVTPAMVL